MSIQIVDSIKDIVVSYTNDRTLETNLVQYLPKADLKVVADYKKGVLFLITDHDDSDKGLASLEIPFADVSMPVVVDLGALVTQVNTWAASGVGTLVDANGNTLLPSGTPAKLTYELTRPADIIGYTIGDAINSSVATPVAITLANASIANNGGGFAFLLKVESNIVTLAGATLRYWFYNSIPSALVGDNVPFVNSYVNAPKRCFYVDVTFDALLAGSDTVIGSVELSKEYITALADTSIYVLIQTLSAFVPTSGGKIYSALSVLKLA